MDLLSGRLDKSRVLFVLMYVFLPLQVKSWAKKHNVNSSKNGTLNSLSICLLVAFHLQVSEVHFFWDFNERNQPSYSLLSGYSTLYSTCQCVPAGIVHLNCLLLVS